METPTTEPRPRHQVRSLTGMGATVVGLHVAGWGALFAWLLPAQTAAGANPGVLLGLASALSA